MDFVSLWHHLTQIHQVIIHKLEDKLEQEASLPLVWFRVLLALQTAPEYSLRLQDLAEAVDMSQSGLTRLLDRMTEADLIARQPCAKDRRGCYAVISPQGQKQLETAQVVYQACLQETLNYLSETQLIQLDGILTGLADAMLNESQ